MAIVISLAGARDGNFRTQRHRLLRPDGGLGAMVPHLEHIDVGNVSRSEGAPEFLPFGVACEQGREGLLSALIGRDHHQRVGVGVTRNGTVGPNDLQCEAPDLEDVSIGQLCACLAR